jgi:hypothetical protein
MKVLALLPILLFVASPALPQERGAAAEPGGEPAKVKFTEFRVYVLRRGGGPEMLPGSTAALRVEPKGRPATTISLSLMRPKSVAPIPPGTTGRTLSPEGAADNVVLVAVPPDALDKPALVPHKGAQDGKPGDQESWKQALTTAGPYFKADLVTPSADFAFKGTLSYTLNEKTETLTFDFPFPTRDSAPPAEKPSK